MCGIAGYWGEGSRKILDEMGGSLTHRGPDAGGAIECGAVGLTHRRLSIVDLSPTGSQPMRSETGNVTIVFNGEIYNHEALRKKFLSQYTFRGTSDTEVLLHLYEELGVSFLNEIRGMFAFAIYDEHKKKLILARDHLGKKPLYYTYTQGTFIFGSELKALRAHPLCPHDISKNAIAQYLVYEYIPSPATIYKDVSKLEAGTYLVYDGSKIIIERYDELKTDRDRYTKSFEEGKNDLYTILDSAVKKRMVADVPVGVFLSGGLDSSTIAYIAQKSSTKQIKTFSIGFTDVSFDESAYAREVALALGTEHHERIVSAHDLQNLIEDIPEVLDEPMADSSIIPTLILSEFASKEVKVVLGGDGADELLLGYDTFFAHNAGLIYEKFPTILKKVIRACSHMLPVSHEYMSLDFKIKKFLSGFDTTRARRNTYWLSAFTPEELSQICIFDIDIGHVCAKTDAIYERSNDTWESLQRDYMKGYLIEDILVKTDRAGMAHGLEVRAPFLDLDLVRFALSLPVQYKRRGRMGKYILKEMMRKLLPSSVTERRKRGFNIPIGSWIRGDLRELFEATILDGELVRSGLFKREGLAILLESHQKGIVDNRKKLWTLFVLALWMKKWT